MEGKQDSLDLTPAEDSLPRVADRLVEAAGRILRSAQTEEDLRIGFEKALEPLKAALGITSVPQYEKTIPGAGGRTVYKSGRSDAVHGQVIIEYEAPSAFESPRAVDHAFDQLVDYLRGEADQRKESVFLLDPRVVGVGFDGERIFFVHYRGDKARPKTTLEKSDFARIGPYGFDQQSARTLLTYMRALSKRLLTAGDLAEVFGPDGPLAKEAVGAFLDAMGNWAANPRVGVLFQEWRRLFGIVYGEHFNGNPLREAESLARIYSVPPGADFQQLLFSIHTYFVFLMKLLAVELLSLHENPMKSLFSDDLAHAGREGLKQKLEDIESGGIYERRRITNFLEGDFFRWYLDAFSPRVEGAVREIARSLAGFEPETGVIAPDSHQDLLKRLYQYLVPGEVRHKLGEFYTPDWLAELVLRESGYDGDPDRRVLDPACGSGTFLVLAIQRARKRAKEQRLPALEAAKRILANIWGFDLNPLAVIAARTNYIFALGDLVGEHIPVEIPVYLADSVLWPRQTGLFDQEHELAGSVPVRTSVGTFHVPSLWVHQYGFLMKRAAPLVEAMTKQGFTPEEANTRLANEGLVYTAHGNSVRDFYAEVLALEKEGKNGIWARFLKNAFAPLVAGKFDLVVGNPPWVRWGYLSKEYREATLPLWRKYGLFSLKGHAARLGGGEKDFSMLFTYAAVDYYLEKKGRLAFLITQEVLKGKGAGEGFRRFSLGESRDFRVLKAHDLVTVQPFEGAANKTAMIVVEKGKPTRYPVPYTLWTRRKGVGKIPTDTPFDDAMGFLRRQRLIARPIGKPTGSWQTVSRSGASLSKIKGTNAYRARLGARVEPYGVFWLSLEQVMSDGSLLVRNLPERGKRIIPKLQGEVVEPDLVFPAVAGAHIERWRAVPGIYVLMSQDPRTCQPYPESKMKSDWPRTFGYLTRFKDVLLSRGSKTVRQFAERTAFYAMFGIGPYTVARYKVVWKRMANDLVAAVISQHKTPFGYKKVIPTDTTSLIATENEAEAHYLCAILNSGPVRDFIKSFSSGGRGFGAPSVMEPVGIPKFIATDSLHKKLASLSMDLHEKTAGGRDMDCAGLERDVEAAVRRLFGLTKG